MKSIMENSMEWLWKHRPDVAIVGMLITAAIWLTASVGNFAHRLDETERLCNDINQRQLPEIRLEIKEMKSEMKEMKSEIKEVRTEIKEMKEEIVEIKLFMRKIDTYLATTDPKYPK